jgi:lipid II:glycine glycyltransferase (peptidoglycan interpeptide bridge formation enzyme)
LFRKNDQPIAAAQILRRALPRTPFGVMYVAKGPAYDLGDTVTLQSVLAAIEQEAKRQRAIFVKVDPDIPLAHPDAQLLPLRGWRVSPEQIQFHNTVVLNLEPSEDELLAALKPKWRYNIRLAERKGVRVRAGDVTDLETFYEMYADTSARDGFLIRQFPYYRDVWSTMLDAGHAQLLLAETGAETIAGLVLFRFGRRAWYFYGASRSAHRERMPNHLLQWEAIRWSKAQGCREYDFWGAPDVLEEQAPMFGVYKFKMGFGGRFVERIPAHDFVLHPLLYWAYAVARPRYLARLRRSAPTSMEG